MLDIRDILVWSAWVPHQGCWLGDRIPNEPDVYRIRRFGQTFLDYSVQTGKGGMTLRKRLGMQGGYTLMRCATRTHTPRPHCLLTAIRSLRFRNCRQC
jgi:hypothetical protein